MGADAEFRTVGPTLATVTTPLPLPPVRVALRALYAALAVLACAGLISAAVLEPAPAAALPFIVLVAIGLPMTAAFELPALQAALGHGRRERRALGRLRRELDRLPEVHHPLGL
jgi:hypothetical protein